MMTLVNFEKPSWVSNMQAACGTKLQPRDLGVVGGYRAFGCGFAMQSSDRDVPKMFGISYVPGRISFRCRKDRISCVQ
jgi:hypothetical protein